MSKKNTQTGDYLFDSLRNLKRFNLPDFQFPTIFKSSEEVKDLRAEALEAEKKALSYTGLEIGKDIHIYDVEIDFQGKNFLHTVEFGRGNQDVLILFPGYGGSSAYMSPLFKGLSQKFHVYHVDYLGMGLSSRPDYTCTTSEEANDYFIDSFEAWIKVMKIQKYYMGGHSLGGYVAPIIAQKHPERCQGLFLMSPKGIASFSDYEPNEEWATSLGKMKSTGWMAYFHYYERLFDAKANAYDLVQKNPVSAKVFLRKYIAGFMKNQEQGEAIGEGLYTMLMIPGGSGLCIHLVLRPPRLSGYLPLTTCVFPDLKEMPIYCYFGVEDWNDWTDVHKYALENENKNVHWVQIENSGHQMTMQNPDLVVEKILSTFNSR